VREKGREERKGREKERKEGRGESTLSLT